MNIPVFIRGAEITKVFFFLYRNNTELFNGIRFPDLIELYLELAQIGIIDAAVEAGVKFFIPSEFGLANTHLKLRRDFPIFEDKIAIQDHLERLSQSHGISYALVFVGLFLDWGMDGFVIDVRNKKVGFWDDGERPPTCGLDSKRSLSRENPAQVLARRRYGSC